MKRYSYSNDYMNGLYCGGSSEQNPEGPSVVHDNELRYLPKPNSSLVSLRLNLFSYIQASEVCRKTLNPKP